MTLLSTSLSLVKSRWMTYTVGTTAATAVAYGVSTSDRPSLIVTRRAARLGVTVAAMMSDYQFQSMPLERQELLQTVRECQAELSQAQAQYSKSGKHKDPPNDDDNQNNNNTNRNLSFSERLVQKRHEKERMLQAAERLAQAQEQLGDHPVHIQAATRLLHLCQQNKGVYIKLGQHLSQLDYLIPIEYSKVLKQLLDDNPVTCPALVQQVFAQEFQGQVPEDVFDSFDYTPIASASLAQVHVAYTKQGHKLAVKIQHHGLAETALMDLSALVHVSDWLERNVPAFRPWGWIAHEIEPLLPQELNFVQEAQNAERAATNLKCFASTVVVPKIWWQYTTPRVVTMDFEDGWKITDTETMKANRVNPRKIARLLSQLFCHQIFVHRWVHCDPHPANVLVRKRHPNSDEPVLILLDHGLYRSLPESFVGHYAHLWKSLLLADISGIREACTQLGLGDVYTLFAALVTARPFDEVMERSQQQQNSSSKWWKALPIQAKDQLTASVDKTVMSGYAQRYLHQILDLLGKIPNEMLLLLKTNDCLRHISSALGNPPTTSLVITGHYAAWAVLQQQRQQSWTVQLYAWWDYLWVRLRIVLHDWFVA